MQIVVTSRKLGSVTSVPSHYRELFNLDVASTSGSNAHESEGQTSRRVLAARQAAHRSSPRDRDPISQKSVCGLHAYHGHKRHDDKLDFEWWVTERLAESECPIS